jgi:anti-sigma B factor antagonist
MQALQLDIDLLPGKVPHLVICGAIDLKSVSWLEQVIDEMMARASDRIVIDFSACTFISSGAIGILIAAAEEYRKRGCRIYAVRPSDPLLHVFTLCALTECLTCVTREEEALAVCA